MVKIKISAGDKDELKQSVQRVSRCFPGCKVKPTKDKRGDLTQEHKFYRAYIEAEALNSSNVQ